MMEREMIERLRKLREKISVPGYDLDEVDRELDDITAISRIALGFRLATLPAEPLPRRVI